MEALHAASAWTLNLLLKPSEDAGLPPGTGPTQSFKGPWFSTQLTLSLFIGLTSFFSFCFLRTRWDLIYMGRTKLKDFSPARAHSPDMQNGGNFLGWILPTLRTSEFTVLQTVGLDAAVLLNFYRMSFMLFSLAALLATAVLMPLNLARHGSTDSPPEDPDDGNSTSPDSLWRRSAASFAILPGNSTTPVTPPPTLTDLILNPQTSATVNLIFTYLFTFLVLAFLHRNFHRFVKSRQVFSLHLIHSIAARTVLVKNLPAHLRGDKALADYFEGCGWTVESVSVCREIELLRRVLKRRTDALLKLEAAWAEWVGNPADASIHGYSPDIYNTKGQKITSSPTQVPSLLPDLDEPSADGNSNGDGSGTPSRSNSNTALDGGEAEEGGLVSHADIHTTRPRPTFHPRTFGAKVDSIEFWEKKFRKADAEVKELRKTGVFGATHAAFVTFEYVKDAVVHYPEHSQVITELAPEPRDVVWSKVNMSKREAMLRDFVAMGIMGVLLVSWIPPVTSLATLLSYQEIKKVLPWLARIIDYDPRFAAIVQNSLPSLAIVIFNGLLPFLLSWLSYRQGFVSRSGTEYSLMRKYYLFLLISVLFIFLLTTTYWSLLRDLADSPAKIPEKLATALQTPNSRNFMVSYVMLQGLGLMPLQLLNLGPMFSLGTSRIFSTKTPRDHAEANAPPMLNYGWVYPQSILIFTITLVFSVVSPLILVFGAVYFGVAYLVFKYKVLFVYFKPYESNGEAWRITFDRLLWALLIFQLFMAGIFSLSHFSPPILPLLMVPLILYTVWWSFTMYRDFGPLSKYLALSSICEVERGEAADAAAGVVDTDGVTRSQSNLNRRRYAMNDETMYVAPSDTRTDYSQPPMSSFYYGVLNTGRRRYAHPALTGSLPFPWLPAKARLRAFGDGAAERRGVVLSLRRKMAKRLRRQQSGDDQGYQDQEGQPGAGTSGGRSGLPEGWTTGDDPRDTTAGGPPPSGSGSGARRASGSGGMGGSQMSNSSNPWNDPTPSPSDYALRKKVSFDPGSGVIALPDHDDNDLEGNAWGDASSDEDEEGTPKGGTVKPESPSTYFHHPERRRTTSLSGGSGSGGQPGSS